LVLHLPIVIWPEPDESFQSWVRRYCRRLAVSPLNLYKAFDFTAAEIRFVSNSHGFGMPQRFVDKLTEATGIPRKIFRDTSFDRYAHLPSLEFDEVRRLRRLHQWIKGTHTRFCIQCLKETDGVFRLDWQVGWTFACVTHQTVLSDWCWSCQGAVAVAPPQTTASPGATTCYRQLNNHSSGRRIRCTADLTLGNLETLDLNSPIISAQTFVDALFARRKSRDAAANIEDLRALCVGLLGNRDRQALEDGARLPRGTLAGLEPESTRVGLVVPADALFFGALVTTAKGLLTGTGHTEFSRLRDIAFGAGSAPSSHSEAWWKNGPSLIVAGFGGSEHTKRRMAHAIDGDLTPRQRIWFGSALPPTESVARPGHELPEELWDEWVFSLDPGGNHNLDAIKKTLNATMRNYGERQRQIEDGVSKRHPLRPSPAFARLGDQILDTNERFPGDFIEGVARLIAHAAECPPSLDYEARRQILDSRREAFLPMNQWKMLTVGAGMNVSMIHQYEIARAYAFERFTGSMLVDNSRPKAPRARRGRPPMIPFVLDLTEQLQRTIDGYLGIILEEACSDAPVREVPTPSLLPVRLLPRGTIADIDLGKMHQLLIQGERSLRRLGMAAGIAARHVPLVVASRPPWHPSRYESEVDWDAIRTDWRDPQSALIRSWPNVRRTPASSSSS
jgi:hypothetical protein